MKKLDCKLNNDGKRGQKFERMDSSRHMSLLHLRLACFVILPKANKQWFRQRSAPEDASAHSAGISQPE
jgi:hypothetical protein